MSESGVPITCTVGPSAVGGQRCGEPAVTTFVGRNGRVYAECAAHDVSAIVARPALEVGAQVTVRHIGIDKVGTVINVGRVHATIEVPVHGGTKFIHRPITEVRI